MKTVTLKFLGIEMLPKKEFTLHTDDTVTVRLPAWPMRPMDLMIYVKNIDCGIDQNDPEELLP